MITDGYGIVLCSCMVLPVFSDNENERQEIEISMKD